MRQLKAEATVATNLHNKIMHLVRNSVANRHRLIIRIEAADQVVQKQVDIVQEDRTTLLLYAPRHQKEVRDQDSLRPGPNQDQIIQEEIHVRKEGADRQDKYS